MGVPSPTAQQQLGDVRLSFDDGKSVNLSTIGKCVLVPRTHVTMYVESQFNGHSGVLRTIALIKHDYVGSHL